MSSVCEHIGEGNIWKSNRQILVKLCVMFGIILRTNCFSLRWNCAADTAKVSGGTCHLRCRGLLVSSRVDRSVGATVLSVWIQEDLSGLPLSGHFSRCSRNNAQNLRIRKATGCRPNNVYSTLWRLNFSSATYITGTSRSLWLYVCFFMLLYNTFPLCTV